MKRTSVLDFKTAKLVEFSLVGTIQVSERIPKVERGLHSELGCKASGGTLLGGERRRRGLLGTGSKSGSAGNKGCNDSELHVVDIGRGVKGRDSRNEQTWPPTQEAKAGDDEGEE